MFANKGRLKVALLVVVGLVVGLWWYAGFQVQEADAHSWSCLFRKHKTETDEETISTRKTGKWKSEYRNCGNCIGSPKKTHILNEFERHYFQTVYYYHGSSYCHKHGPTRKKSTYWVLELCGG